ncbi:hypothetical protein H5410_047264 [Solanum commersonii]|uniref:Uncharacterized protein n=1 Tax=Solanum commersonii TaxID=4109 RepID=A0A9J5XI46_SOLCO|nr:hypothetical protein H5410_047264 [Solanum commersonii]
MNYVHLGGIQILVKSTFKEGINCPIVINLSDERFMNAREGNLEIQHAQIPEENEIQFGKTQEIESPSISNPRLSIDYGRNSIRKSISDKYPKRILENPNITRIMGRIYNGTEWKSQEILIQTGATANHIKGMIIEGLQIYEGNPYNYKTFEGNNFSCKKMIDLPIQLDTIRITVPCYITNHESDQNLILGNLFLNSLEDYSRGRNGIEMIYKNETCFIPKK